MFFEVGIRDTSRRRQYLSKTHITILVDSISNGQRPGSPSTRLCCSLRSSNVREMLLALVKSKKSDLLLNKS